MREHRPSRRRHYYCGHSLNALVWALVSVVGAFLVDNSTCIVEDCCHDLSVLLMADQFHSFHVSRAVGSTTPVANLSAVPMATTRFNDAGSQGHGRREGGSLHVGHGCTSHPVVRERCVLQASVAGCVENRKASCYETTCLL